MAGGPQLPYLVLHWNGTAWAEVPMLAATHSDATSVPYLEAVWVTEGDVWVGGDNALLERRW